MEGWVGSPAPGCWWKMPVQGPRQGDNYWGCDPDTTQCSVRAQSDNSGMPQGGHGLQADRLADLSRPFTLLRVNGCFSTQVGMWKRTQQLACVCFLITQVLCHRGQLLPIAIAEGCQFSVVFQFSVLKWFQEQGVWGDEIECFSVIPSPALLNGYLKFLTSNVTPHQILNCLQKCHQHSAHSFRSCCSRKASPPSASTVSRHHLRKLPLPFPEWNRSTRSFFWPLFFSFHLFTVENVKHT